MTEDKAEETCRSRLQAKSFVKINRACGRATGGEDSLLLYGYKKYLGAYATVAEMNANAMVKVQLDYSADKQRFVWLWPTFSQVPCECLLVAQPPESLVKRIGKRLAEFTPGGR